jgi:hypothetical protein
LRESIDRFLETPIRVQIPGVVKIREADRQGKEEREQELPKPRTLTHRKVWPGLQPSLDIFAREKKLGEQ